MLKSQNKAKKKQNAGANILSILVLVQFHYIFLSEHYCFMSFYFIETKEITRKQNITWKRNVTYITPRINWDSRVPSFGHGLESTISFFIRYISKELFESIAFYTNMYHVQNNTKFECTTAEEIKTFVGIHIIMGNLHYPRLRLYWNAEFVVPVIAENMTYNRFSKLRTHIHFVDNINDVNESDRFWKVRPLYNAIKKRCNELSLETNLSIDEQMIPFKGQINIKQYVKGKPCPWGINE
jgi:hypothetical protein